MLSFFPNNVTLVMTTEAEEFQNLPQLLPVVSPSQPRVFHWPKESNVTTPGTVHQSRTNSFGKGVGGTIQNSHGNQRFTRTFGLDTLN